MSTLTLSSRPNEEDVLRRLDGLRTSLNFKNEPNQQTIESILDTLITRVSECIRQPDSARCILQMLRAAESQIKNLLTERRRPYADGRFVKVWHGDVEENGKPTKPVTNGKPKQVVPATNGKQNGKPVEHSPIFVKPYTPAAFLNDDMAQFLSNTQSALENVAKMHGISVADAQAALRELETSARSSLNMSLSSLPDSPRVEVFSAFVDQLNAISLSECASHLRDGLFSHMNEHEVAHTA